VSEPSRRAKRVAQTIRDHVARYIVTQVGDARLVQVVVTDVRVSDDLGVAHIGVRLLVSHNRDGEHRQCIKQLQLLAGRLRRSLAPVLGLRRVPELRFSFDEGYDEVQRVEQILKEIHSEPEEKS